MNFSKLKESRLRKKISKLISKSDDGRVVSQKIVKSVAILTTNEISSKINIQSEIETTLGVRNSKIYSFKNFDKLDEVSYKHFSEKDINWRGNFVQQNFLSFLEQPFDLLIGYFESNNLYLEMAVLQSEATFKVGFSDVNSELYELEISEKIENIHPFLSELKKYLIILQKLKN